MLASILYLDAVNFIKYLHRAQLVYWFRSLLNVHRVRRQSSVYCFELLLEPHVNKLAQPSLYVEWSQPVLKNFVRR